MGKGPRLCPAFCAAPTLPGEHREDGPPAISRADFTFCLLAIDWGWSVEVAADRLMQESDKAHRIPEWGSGGRWLESSRPDIRKGRHNLRVTPALLFQSQNRRRDRRSRGIQDRLRRKAAPTSRVRACRGIKGLVPRPTLSRRSLPAGMPVACAAPPPAVRDWAAGHAPQAAGLGRPCSPRRRSACWYRAGYTRR